MARAISSGMNTARTVTAEMKAALKGIGLVCEERGGDPKRSVIRNGSNVRRSARVTMILRADGRQMTTADIKAAKTITA